MNVCKRCVLNDNIASVRINEEGVCNYCERENGANHGATSPDYARKSRLLAEAADSFRDRDYQVLLAYSGGKDSTYALHMLRKQYGFSVLAVTFDNGFLNDQCRRNMHAATTALDVDHLVIKPSFANLAKVFDAAGKLDIFPGKALERASSICTACIGLIKSAIYKEAMLRRIPYISFGWTPGQVLPKSSVVRLDRSMILANQRQIKEPLVRLFGLGMGKYFIDDDWMEERQADIPAQIYPLVFGLYDEELILDTIRTIGWRKPEDTDTNSTNCLLNAYANDIHMKRYGFNPYSLEIAALVRSGSMTREEGMRRLMKPGDERIIGEVKQVIGQACNPN
ncbi:hypothetical protein D3C75_210940 [compost metagenome]